MKITKDDYSMDVGRLITTIYEPDRSKVEVPTETMVHMSSKLLANADKETIANHLFDIANKLSGDETGHLAAIIHSVVSELWNKDADAFNMIADVQSKLALVRALQGGK